MVSLTNPYVLIGLVLALFGAFYRGYMVGEDAENQRQQIEIARLNAEARQKEQALVAAVNTQATELVKAKNEAKSTSDRRNADIDSGALRLRVKAECPVSVPNNPAVASGNSTDTTAELDRETAKALIAIAEDGDNAIRQLNACVKAYEELRNDKR